MKKKKPGTKSGSQALFRPSSPFFTSLLTADNKAERQRIIELLAHLLNQDRLTVPEISKILDIPENQVTNWLKAAHLDLYRYLNEVRKTEEEHLQLQGIAIATQLLPTFQAAFQQALEGKTTTVIQTMKGIKVVPYTDGKLRNEAVSKFMRFVTEQDHGMSISLSQRMSQKQAGNSSAVDQQMDFESIVRMIDQRTPDK
jgi:predicted HTH domain antitoxin